MERDCVVIKEKGVSWEAMPGPLLNGDRLTCKIGGTIVSGKVSLTPKAIGVKMDFPREIGVTMRTIDCMSPVIFTENVEEGSPASPYGLATARELLVAQYYGDVMQKD